MSASDWSFNPRAPTSVIILTNQKRSSCYLLIFTSSNPFSIRILKEEEAVKENQFMNVWYSKNARNDLKMIRVNNLFTQEKWQFNRASKRLGTSSGHLFWSDQVSKK